VQLRGNFLLPVSPSYCMLSACQKPDYNCFVYSFLQPYATAVAPTKLKARFSNPGFSPSFWASSSHTSHHNPNACNWCPDWQPCSTASRRLLPTEGHVCASIIAASPPTITHKRTAGCHTPTSTTCTCTSTILYVHCGDLCGVLMAASLYLRGAHLLVPLIFCHRQRILCIISSPFQICPSLR
jgi:hypothetical protein